MLPTLARRLAQPAKEGLAKRATLTMANNPYKTRKEWPPNFKELNPQQQLRFEKKYKRRIILASRSPRWEKAVKYTQLFAITTAVLWIIFYGEFDWWGQKYRPSEEIRKRAGELFSSLDAEKRYERRPDAPPLPSSASVSSSPSKEEPESK